MPHEKSIFEIKKVLRNNFLKHPMQNNRQNIIKVSTIIMNSRKTLAPQKFQ